VFADGQRVTGVDIPLLHHLASDKPDEYIGHLGTDLCGELDLDLAVDRVASDETAHLSAALLDQRNVAGFGNIYAVDVPFICGLSPFTTVGDVVDLDALMAIGAALIRTNAVRGPQNTTGKKLHLGDTWMIDSKRRDCPLCGETIEKRSGSKTPWGRRTAWCVSCQRPEHHTVDRERAGKLLGLHPARHLLDLSQALPYIGERGPVAI